jgi:signal transduction histidine kinase
MIDGRDRGADAVSVLVNHDDDRFVVRAGSDDHEVAYCADGLPDRLSLDRSPEGESVADAFGGRLGEGIGRECRTCVGTGQRRTLLGRSDGAVYETELRPVRSDGQQWVLGTVREVTDRERVRPLPDRTAELFDAVLDHVPLHLYVKDREARHVAVSDFYIDRLPFVTDRSDVIGRTDAELLPDDMGEESTADDRRVIEDGEPLLKKEQELPSLGMWTLTSKIPWTVDGEVRGLVGVTIDVTRRKQYAERLERKTEQLEAFAGIITHDLKNPLSAAAGYLELARETGADEHFEEAEAAVERAAGITDGLERLVRASGELAHEETVDAGDVARRAWDDVGSAAGRLSLEPIAVDGDPDWLRTLFENVFRNAVEHAGDGVAVAVGPLDDRAGFYVADDGPGIPPDRREAVFESGVTSKAGTGGTGLWIVARVADAHGWDLAVVESESGGARFEVATDPDG